MRSGPGTGGPPPGNLEGSGDTIALVTADIEGRGVSLIQSLFYGFGSGLLEPDDGRRCAQSRRLLLAGPHPPNRLARPSVPPTP